MQSDERLKAEAALILNQLKAESTEVNLKYLMRALPYVSERNLSIALYALEAMKMVKINKVNRSAAPEKFYSIIEVNNG